ncbi:MAG TPA: hypothetical protein VD994_20235 [Prosthecobacter sp.]|nr:hypothetical protein [Prosthecobacter sp.]
MRNPLELWVGFVMKVVMPKQTKTRGWQEVTKKASAAVEEVIQERHGLVEKAGEVVQTVLGTMAGAVSGIGILVTGTKEEKKARAAAAKKVAKKGAAKKAAAKKAVKKRG